MERKNGFFLFQISIFGYHFCRPFDRQYCRPPRLCLLVRPHQLPSPVSATGTDICSMPSEVIIHVPMLFFSHRLVSKNNKYDFQFCVSVHHITINKSTSLMQLISIYFTYSRSLHVSGRTLPIIRRI